MKRKMKMAMFAVMSVVMLASCDKHEAIDTNTYPGYILCNDHKVMSLDEYKSQQRSKAVGVVFAVANKEHPTYAVMLYELNDIQFCDSVMDQGTSKDLTAFDGNANTVALQNSYDAATKHGSPMANYAYNAGAYGQSVYIPSLSEMKMLIQSLPVVNPVLRELGGHEISQENDSCWYWTSTEVSANSVNQGWLVSAATGSYIETPKTGSHSVRTIVSIY